MIGIRTMPWHRNHENDRDSQQQEWKKGEHCLLAFSSMLGSECYADIRRQGGMPVILVTAV